MGGDLPRWPLANVYTGCMIGSHGMVSIAEAVAKGQAGKLNLTFVYGLMKATGTTPRRNGGRPYVADYLKHGYVPSEDDFEAASLTLAYSFDDSAIAAVAAHLGLDDDAAHFSARSQSAYRALWSPTDALMCPRSRGGALACPSALEARTPYPLEKNYTEGDALQWLWFVPHDPEGLVALFGDNASFVAKLGGFIADSRTPAQGGKWPYGTVLANGWCVPET